MKMRHQAAINKEQVTPGSTCGKKSTALTSTEWSRLWRQAQSTATKALHLDMKKKDSKR